MLPHGPIIEEIEFCEPFDVARGLAHASRLAFLDSAMPDSTLGRWSYIAANPAGVFTVVDGSAFWNGQPEPVPPLPALRQRLAERSRPRRSEGPPFQGGAIGHLAYEAGRLFETLPAIGSGSQVQIDIAFYDRVLAFDVIERRAFSISSDGAPLRSMGPLAPVEPLEPVRSWTDSRSRAAFEAEVASLVEAIRNGDLFQANLAHRFTCQPSPRPGPFSTYHVLRSANPAPFGALLVDGDDFIASTSPERYIQLEGRLVETRPIKGTRRRDPDPTADVEVANALSQSEKDRAENTMIVDLLRNDLSRVCEPGTVAVPVLCGVETYASVHHLVSVVTGRLTSDCDIVDLIAATFPGGSITGAPKIKAMEYISAIENEPRGPYCGAIGWIDDAGDADFNIAIRTLVCRNGTFSLHAGGGITLLSDPAAEYDETLAKAERILGALEGRL